MCDICHHSPHARRCPNAEDTHPICPICDNDSADFYFTTDNMLVGCSWCLKKKPYYDVTQKDLERTLL